MLYILSIFHSFCRFSATIRFTYGSQQGCGGNIQATSTETTQIQSLDADRDGNYEPELNCQWVVTGEPGKVLKLTFSLFNIERDVNATSITCWDYVEIRDGFSPFSPLNGHYCGTTAPRPITTSNNFMWIKFYSDSTTNQRGFVATVQSVDPICGSLGAPLNATNEISVLLRDF